MRRDGHRMGCDNFDKSIFGPKNFPPLSAPFTYLADDVVIVHHCSTLMRAALRRIMSSSSDCPTVKLKPAFFSQAIDMKVYFKPINDFASYFFMRCKLSLKLIAVKRIHQSMIL